MAHLEATERLRQMHIQAAKLSDLAGGSLITEFFGGTCVQACGRVVHRNTLDGVQKTVEVRWFIDCKRTSRRAVLKRFGTTVKE